MRRPLLLLVTVFSSACAGTVSGPGAAVPEEPLRIAPDPAGPDRTQCYVADGDGVRPAGTVFEEEAFERLVGSLPAGGAVVLTVATDSTGLPTTLRVVESSLPGGVAETFRDSLAARFRPADDPALGSVRMRLRVDGGPEPVVRTAPSFECFPELANREEVERLLSRAAAQAYRSGRALVWIRVGGDGSPVETRLSESSGDSFTDALAIGVATQMRFLPAVRDRVPVRVWVQIPISITTP